MVVNSYCKNFLCLILTDNILIKKIFDLLRFQQLEPIGSKSLVLLELFFNNSMSLFNTIIAYMSFHACNQQVHFFLLTTAKGTFIDFHLRVIFIQRAIIYV